MVFHLAIASLTATRGLLPPPGNDTTTVVASRGVGTQAKPASSCVCHSIPTYAIPARAMYAWTSAVPGCTRTGSGGGMPSAGLVVSGIWCPPLSKSWTAGTPSSTQALADRLPKRIEAPSWPPVRAPIPPKTACRSAAWHGRVPAELGGDTLEYAGAGGPVAKKDRGAKLAAGQGADPSEDGLQIRRLAWTGAGRARRGHPRVRRRWRTGCQKGSRRQAGRRSGRRSLRRRPADPPPGMDGCRPSSAGTPSSTQALADRLPKRIEAPSWPPVRAPIPPKTACRSAAWHGRVPAELGGDTLEYAGAGGPVAKKDRGAKLAAGQGADPSEDGLQIRRLAWTGAG